MSAPFGSFRPTGVQQFLAGDRITRAEKRLDAEVARAEETGAHVWIVAVAYRLSPEKARQMAFGDDSDPALLDAESMLSVAPCCYRCEEPLTRRRLGRPCPGDPS